MRGLRMWSWALTVTILGVQILVICMVLLEERRQPSATLAWLWLLIFLPIVGVIFYLLIGRGRVRRKARSHGERAARAEEALRRMDVNRKLKDAAADLTDNRAQAMSRLVRNMTGRPATRGNAAEILRNADKLFERLYEDIDAAEHHVHVMFYTVQPDHTGEALRDRLTAKAREGVEVRMIVDAVGSYRLPGDFWAPLEEAGGQAAAFSPVSRVITRLGAGDRVDYRNHRKIAVIDGRVGYAGGINFGRQYLGEGPEFGAWRDTHVRLAGPAALSIQAVFAEDCMTATDDVFEGEVYFPEPDTDCGPHDVDIVASGPCLAWSPFRRAFAEAFALASDRIWITTPYLTAMPEVNDALTTAALRGVDVRLVLPTREYVDRLIVLLAGEAEFPTLLEAGVRVFSYKPGFMHAKTVLVDDWLGTIGSCNMDNRSMHLDYEMNAFIYGPTFAAMLAEEFAKDFADSVELERDRDFKNTAPLRLVRNAARLLSPLL